MGRESLDAAKLYSPPRHTRPQNTTAGRLAAMAEGVFVQRADTLVCDAVLAGLTERFKGREVDDEVIYDILITLLSVLFPEQFEAADADLPDTATDAAACLTDTERQAVQDGRTERERRERIARENGLPDGHAAGLMPDGGSVERVGTKQLMALAARLKLQPKGEP